MIFLLLLLFLYIIFLYNNILIAITIHYYYYSCNSSNRHHYCTFTIIITTTTRTALTTRSAESKDESKDLKFRKIQVTPLSLCGGSGVEGGRNLARKIMIHCLSGVSCFTLFFFYVLTFFLSIIIFLSFLGKSEREKGRKEGDETGRREKGRR